MLTLVGVKRKTSCKAKISLSEILRCVEKCLVHIAVWLNLKLTSSIPHTNN